LVALKVRYGEALKAFGAVGESGSTEKEHEMVIKDSAEEIVSRDHRVSPYLNPVVFLPPHMAWRFV